MSSTNKTSHLRLNQWVAGDPILRTDFNFDNSKLDEAVNARALVTLAQASLTAEATSLPLDLTDLDLGQYVQLQLFLRPVMRAEAAVTLQVNDTTAVTLGTMAADGSRGLEVHLSLLPGGLGGWWMAPGGTGTTSGTFRVSGVTAADVTALTLGCAGSAAFASGTTCTLCGVKG